jgi:hypothetical protein
MSRLRTPSILGTVIVGVLAMTSTPARAEVSIAVSPALLELEARPGDTGRIPLTVSVEGDEPVDVVTDITPFAGMVDHRSAVEWSTVTPRRASLEPGDRLTLEYVVEIPDDAPTRGRYATITITTAPAEGPDATPATTGSTVAGRIEVPVFLTVVGDEDLLRRPIVLERTALFLGQDGTLSVLADVTNGGNVHVRLTGAAIVTDPSASPGPSHAPLPAPLGELAITMGRVLPGTTRTYVASGSLSLPLDVPYDVTVEMGPPRANDDDAMREPIVSATERIVASPSMSVGALEVCQGLDGAFRITASLVNEGRLGLVPVVSFELLDATGVLVGTARASVQALSWPGSTVGAVGDLPPGLPEGAWTLVARVSYGEGLATSLSQPFVIGAVPEAPPSCPIPEASPEPSPATSPAASPPAGTP